jgi:hypothetical protein
MTDPVDDRFADLVRRAAPAGRDPLFRLQVLERREQDRFRRSCLTLLGLLVSVIAAAAVILSLGPPRFDWAAIVLLGVVAAPLGFLYAPALLQRLQLSRL